MTHSIDESLSALVDGETSVFETRRLHNSLCDGGKELASWEHYHLIRESMRGNLSEFRKDFAARVMAQLDEAPAVPAQTRSFKLVKPAIGLALAASVAVVTVLGVQSLTGPSVMPLAPASVAQVDSAVQDVQQVTADALEQLSFGASAAPRLNSYLVNHAEYASRRSMMPYARIVGYDMTDAEE